MNAVMEAVREVVAENKAAAAALSPYPAFVGAMTPQIQGRLHALGHCRCQLPAIRYELRKLEKAGELLAFRWPGYLTRWYPAKDEPLCKAKT